MLAAPEAVVAVAAGAAVLAAPEAAFAVAAGAAVLAAPEAGVAVAAGAAVLARVTLVGDASDVPVALIQGVAFAVVRAAVRAAVGCVCAAGARADVPAVPARAFLLAAVLPLAALTSVMPAAVDDRYGALVAAAVAAAAAVLLPAVAVAVHAVPLPPAAAAAAAADDDADDAHVRVHAPATFSGSACP